ncbi:MAG: 4-hydroxybenzoate octaprenyltransferase [Planctomycetota bacterium]|nr:MAG: 4-hydroxybenzoate octaprenyltransferase [Planctomycetota bacterium]
MAQLTRGPHLLLLADVARDIKLAHSVFAMPFAILGAFLARDADLSWGVFAAQLMLVVACMIAARTWAMLVNRLADRSFDAVNPRTARRLFASNQATPRQGWIVALGAAALFVSFASAFGLAFANWLPAALSLPVLAWIALYSYTKRFTWLCHLFLGGALAASPIAAAIAVRPTFLTESASVWWLAAMVACWVAGFDVIYALQDIAFDRTAGLKSVPARFGPKGAIWISRLLHLAAFAALAMAWSADDRLQTVTLLALAIVAGLLIAEHVVLARRGQDGLEMAFFTLNGIVSCVFGLLASIDSLA